MAGEQLLVLTGYIKMALGASKGSEHALFDTNHLHDGCAILRSSIQHNGNLICSKASLPSTRARRDGSSEVLAGPNLLNHLHRQSAQVAGIEPDDQLACASSWIPTDKQACAAAARGAEGSTPSSFSKLPTLFSTCRDENASDASAKSSTA